MLVSHVPFTCENNMIKFSLHPTHSVVTQVFNQGPKYKGYLAPCTEREGKLHFIVYITQDTIIKSRKPTTVEFDIIPDKERLELKLFASTIY